jgi:hypothetical protein
MFTCEVENADEFASFWQRRVVRTIEDGLRKAVNRAAREGATEAIQRHTFTNRSGDLERSIGSIVDAGSTTDDYGAEIVALAQYASYVEDGTKPHVIEARRTAMLRWVNQLGAVMFRMRVNHPGTAPRPFMGLAYIKAEAVLIRECELALEKAQQALESA